MLTVYCVFYIVCFYCNLGLLLIFYMHICHFLPIQLLGCHIEINACLLSPFQMSVRPMVACRVRPLTDVDWCGGGQRHAGSSTSSPGVAAPPSSVQQNRTGDGGGPVRRELEHSSVITVTPPASRRCVVAPTSTVPLSYDSRAIAVDDILTSVGVQHHDVVETKITVYDNVQQLLHV